MASLGNYQFNLCIGGISLFFVILTTFLIPICILVGWSGMRSYGKEYITASLICEFLMIAMFCMLDSLLFYVLPESVLIPMLCVVFETKKDQGSISIFPLNFTWICFYAISYSVDSSPNKKTDLQISLTTKFSERRQIFLWIASFTSFGIKVPMVPVHIWLPEAHVEAPTTGSVTLAGIPLKLGTYGLLRFSIPMFPEVTLCSTPFIYTSSAIAMIYTSSSTLRHRS
ncbi:hypothetical protein M9H77_02894 [Catharanthus roseus]|uniref:Uncharacterized protein n=1 Tax=Catharanthus roseus TaxID=4058 RepID=A0ACC0C9R5_CATRO|nr:hypothetical protein M9H77_02894 [Catharanthus roseus]